VANVLHAEITIKALNAGKHVLCEKPMAVTLEQCEAMQEAAEKNGRILMIGHNQRFALAHQEASRMIREGVIGRVLSFETKFGHGGPEIWTGTANTWFFHKDQAAFGSMADLGIHKTDLMHYLIGEPITQVYAHTATLDKRYPDGNLIDVEDNAWCIYRTESGITGTMHASWTDYGKEYNSIIVHGTGGSIRCYDDREYSLILETDDGRQNFLSTEDMITNNDQTIGTGKSMNSGVIDEFVECILTGKPCRCTGEEALKAMRVIFAAMASSQVGRMVTVLENR
jgi:predicted dehydrogenase